MNLLKLLCLSLIISMVYGCGEQPPKEPTPKEKMIMSIQAYIGTQDSIVSMEIMDTISLESINDRITKIETGFAILDSQITRLPNQIEAAKERLANAEKEYENADSPLFKSSWKSVIVGEQKNVLSFEDLLIKNRISREESTPWHKFLINIRDSKNEIKCYYQCKTTNKEQKINEYFVSSDHVITQLK